jgi:hypothetical protein
MDCFKEYTAGVRYADEKAAAEAPLEQLVGFGRRAEI